MKETKTIKSSDILDKKILFEIENGSNITDFIVKYINEKTYKSFRTFSKRLKNTIKQLFEDGIIDDKDLKKIEDAIKTKTKYRKPEIIFGLNDYLKDFKELFEYSKNNKNNIGNWFFLMLPFLTSKGLKEIKSIKYSEIKIHRLTDSIIVSYEPIDSEELPVSLKISNYYKEWLSLFELYKKDYNEDELIFTIVPQTHHHLNVLLDSSLRKYVSDVTSPYKYFTIVKNALKYNKDSFITII